MKIFPFFIVAFCSLTYAEGEKSTWQSFVDFFNPNPTTTDTSPIGLEIQRLDKEIRETKQDYTREHRPQRKNMLKRQLNELNTKRDSLVVVLEKEQKSSSSVTKEIQSSNSVSSSSEIQNDTPKEQKPELAACDTVWVIQKRTIHDTIFVRDTVFIRDTVWLEQKK